MEGERQEIRRVVRSDELAEGGAFRFRLVLEGREVEAFAIRFRGEVRAFVNVCAHRAIPLDLGRGAFFHPEGKLLLCRAHGALYDPLTGACAGGICPRTAPLRQVPVEERDGWIVVVPAAAHP